MNMCEGAEKLCNKTQMMGEGGEREVEYRSGSRTALEITPSIIAPPEVTRTCSQAAQKQKNLALATLLMYIVGGRDMLHTFPKGIS